MFGFKSEYISPYSVSTYGSSGLWWVKVVTYNFSDCGYDHAAAYAKRCQNAVDFTGCLAHLKVTYHADNNIILWGHGNLEHIEACNEAELPQEPTHPLHPSVVEIALAQRKVGALLDAIQSQNWEMYQSHGYIGMLYDLADSPYHWLIGPTDMQKVYQQHNWGIGVNMSSPDYLNVDFWIDPSSSKYNSTLTYAILHYQAWAMLSNLRFALQMMIRRMQPGVMGTSCRSCWIGHLASATRRCCHMLWVTKLDRLRHQGYHVLLVITPTSLDQACSLHSQQPQ